MVGSSMISGGGGTSDSMGPVAGGEKGLSNETWKVG